MLILKKVINKPLLYNHKVILRYNIWNYISCNPYAKTKKMFIYKKYCSLQK